MTPAPDEWLVAAVGALPGPPRVVRASRQSELLAVLGLRDPVPAEYRAVLATTWRALAEGVPRVYVAPDADALAAMPEPLVVTGAAALPATNHAGERLFLHDPPAPPAAPGDVPDGMVGLWPWVSLVLPGLPAAVAVPPSVLAAGLFARGVAGTTYAADPLPGPAPPGPPDDEGGGWVRLVPAGRRRLLHLDPAPGPAQRPGSPFPLETADETTLAILWAEVRDAANPVEAFTRALHARYGAGVRVFLEDAGLRVTFPPPAARARGVTVRFTART